MKSRQKSLITLLLVIVFIAFSNSLVKAQEVLTIKKTDNTVISIPTSDIVTITFGSTSPMSDGNTVTDIDGNTYQTVKIGYQVWMTENLKTTRYNNGGQIPNIKDKQAWANSTSGAYCLYDNSSGIKDLFGVLYNWYAVSTDKLCPVGWRVPTDDDWTSMLKPLGVLAGAKLKEAGTANWKSNTDMVTNETKFTALPGGTRYGSGSFTSIGTQGTFWTSTPNGEKKEAVYRVIVDYNSSVARYMFPKSSGLSVRCIKE